MPDPSTSPSRPAASSSSDSQPQSRSIKLDPIAESMADNKPASLWARVRLPSLLYPSQLPSYPLSSKLQADQCQQLVITPITFLSFLLSLCLIDSYTTGRIGPQSQSPPTLRQQVTNVVHRMLFKQNPTYKYRSSHVNTKPTGEIKGEKAEVAKKAGEHWYWHTHQRKLMRMEVDDAFRIRRWVMVVMCMTAFVFSAVALWAGMKVVGGVFEMMGKRGAAGVAAIGNHVHG